MPDAAGNIRGIALNGRAAESWERIFGERECGQEPKTCKWGDACADCRPIGFTACWKIVEGKPGNCRKPEGHKGECAPF
jgi:hypothetical protein